MEAKRVLHKPKTARRQSNARKNRAVHARAQEDADYVIVGAGMAGAAAARYISREAPNARTVVLEQESVAHPKGSSYGDSRMYRLMNSSKFYSDMQAHALPFWDELEKTSNQELRFNYGLLFYGEADTGETIEGSVPGAAKTCAELGIDHTYYSSNETLESLYPMYTADNYEGVFEYSAGSVNSSKTCKALGQLAQQNGVQLFEGDKVTNMSIPQSNQVYISTSKGRSIRAKKVIVAAGAWANDVLAHIGKQMDLEVHNVHWGHYTVETDENGNQLYDYPQAFCFRKPRSDYEQGLNYLFNCHSVSSEVPMVKTGIDFTPNEPRFRTSNMDSFMYEPDETVSNLIDQWIRTHWKGIKDKVEMLCSPYSMSKDSNFVLDTIPGAEEVITFTAGCGRGFKYAPLIGKLLADLAFEREPEWDIRPFSAKRDAVQLKPAVQTARST